MDIPEIAAEIKKPARGGTLTKLSVSTILYAILAICSVMGAAAQPGPSQSEAPGIASLSVVTPVMQCEKLLQTDISSAVGAKTHITSAINVPTGTPAPYCKINGSIEPAINFELRLPLQTWSQRFVQTGCGGLCGQLNIRLENAEGCYPANHGELALASTDMGHSGVGTDAEFGKNWQLRIDFAYRGVHLTALAAKALISRFYGQDPKYSYFSGCSDGGREALMEAERFPKDFDGITAGAPAMNFTTQNTFYHGWNSLANSDADGKPILTADKLPILHRAALAACDAADGLKDGLISNPVACHFDPSILQCKPGQDADQCLTRAQVEVARAIYKGAHDSKGDKLVLSGPLPGSELAWAGVYIPTSGADRVISTRIATSSLRYLVYSVNPPASYTLRDLQFTMDSFQQATRLHGLYDATDPDLRPFAKVGGKLILWHGLADPHISPLNTIAYYAAMNNVMGDSEVQRFARLYLFPGMYHCGGGEGPFKVDLMNAIMAWVEKGSAPFAIVASQQSGGDGGPTSGVPFQILPRSRPVYPYPLTSKYKGTGDVNDAANFEPGAPEPVPASELKWLGSSFYTPNYELWCQADSADSVKCDSAR